MKQSDDLMRQGFVWHRSAIDKASLNELRTILQTDSRPGNRLSKEAFAAAAPHLAPMFEAARNVLPGCFPVRAITFIKSPEINWAVGWHQDRVIAVEDKHAVDGFSNWTKKGGVWNCEPPADVLQKMIFARIHLDEATVRNGCLEVLPGSHRVGRVSLEDIPVLVDEMDDQLCEAKAGDVLFGQALLIHRSKPSVSTQRRLALRIDFANTELPVPLIWDGL